MTSQTGHEPSDGKVGVVMCEDHSVLSDAMAMLIDLDPELELVSPPTPDPFEAIEQSKAKQPQVVLMDVDLGSSIDGVEATRRIKQGGAPVQVLLMTAMQDEELLVRAVEAGASGLIRKTEPATKVLQALKAAAAGESLVDPSELTRVLQQVAAKRHEAAGARLLLEQLTARETEILQMLAEGFRNDEIAGMLTLSVHTVNTHVRNALGKLGVSSKLEAVVFAARQGAITLGGRRPT